MSHPTRPSVSQARIAKARSYAPAVRWVSIFIILLSFISLIRLLPQGEWLEALQDWIQQLGVGGPLVFGLIYVVAVVLLFPAWMLTVAAAAVFDPVVCLITVSLASTTGAALAFLISRYLARKQIARKLTQYPRFEAIDKAVREGGWKIVALLRLSPAIPFNLQNYLYGVTGIPFWTCVLTSWVAMLPGTIMYVYLGYAGRAGLEASSGAVSKTPGEWVLLGLGLVATIVVTIYVTALARKALRCHTKIGQPAETGEVQASGKYEPIGLPVGTIILALIGLLMLAAAVYFQINHHQIHEVLGERGASAP
jgi:uncharacterized membrane protein YdjX (TVP38/TMEM64 family)